MMKYLLMLLFLTSCGFYQDNDTVYENPPGGNNGSYSFADFEKYCFGCHNSSAPKIPLDEKGFKSSRKVIARIKDGSMPPQSGGFNKGKALAYFKKGE